MSLNKVMLIGNVGQDPEIRYLNDQQTKVGRIRLATTERYSDRNGETRENTEWHTLVCWRKQADLAEKYIKKGTQIYVEGRLQTREWTDNSGAKRTSTEIVVDNIQLLGRRQDNQTAENGQMRQPASTLSGTPAGPGGYQAPYQPHTNVHGTPASPAFNGGADDDLPF